MRNKQLGPRKDKTHSIKRHTKSQRGSLEEVGLEWVPLPGSRQHLPSCPRIIDGVTYSGNIREKIAAQEQYSAAVARGESAGLVK